MLINPLPKAVAPADIAPERLANNAALTEQQKIHEASRQFEAILLRQILSASQKTVIPSKFADNSTASEIYRDMVTQQLADTMSKSGAFGLAQTFEHQLTRPAHPAEASPSPQPLALTPGSKHPAATPARSSQPLSTQTHE